MSRGKPSPIQLDLSAEMLDIPSGPLSYYDAPDGSKTDMRNYGGLTGIPAMRELAAEFLEIDPGDVIIGGNASLSMMYDNINFAYLFGVPGGSGPWGKISDPSFVAVVPGYSGWTRTVLSWTKSRRLSLTKKSSACGLCPGIAIRPARSIPMRSSTGWQACRRGGIFASSATTHIAFII
jgi:hypothetical protein